MDVSDGQSLLKQRLQEETKGSENKPGIGFPIARIVVVLSLATAYVINEPGRKQDPFVVVTTLFQNDGKQEVTVDDIETIGCTPARRVAIELYYFVVAASRRI